jgi:hypothetical protein
VVSAPVATPMATFGWLDVSADRGKSLRLGVLLVGDTGFEPVTSSVSVISCTPDNAAVTVKMVRGCPKMIAGCRSD